MPCKTLRCILKSLCPELHILLEIQHLGLILVSAHCHTWRISFSVRGVVRQWLCFRSAWKKNHTHTSRKSCWIQPIKWCIRCSATGPWPWLLRLRLHCLVTHNSASKSPNQIWKSCIPQIIWILHSTHATLYWKQWKCGYSLTETRCVLEKSIIEFVV